MVIQDVAQTSNVMLEQVTQKIKDIFDTNFDVRTPSTKFDSTHVRIIDYISTLPIELKNELMESYYSRFVGECVKESSESILETGWTTLLLGRETDLDIIFEVLSTIYGDNGEKDNLEYLLSLFDSFSVSQNNEYVEKINELKYKYDEVLNPITFEETIIGRWISVDDFPINNYTSRFSNQLNLPQFIIDFGNISQYNGASLAHAPTLDYSVSSYKNTWLRSYDYMKPALTTSQNLYFDGKEEFARVRFISEKINEAQTETAISGHESNRRFEADTKAKIWSSKNGSFGEKLAADAITSVYVGLSDAIFDALAVGSKRVEVYQMDFSNPTSSTMDAVIAYQNVKEKTTGVRTTKKDITGLNHFVKWEESDSVIFISQGGKPIFAGYSLSKDSPLLDEYKAIKKKYNFWKPKYWIPTTIGVGVAGYCFGQSIQWMIDDIKKDKVSAKSIILSIVGGGVLGGALGYYWGKIQIDRGKKYKEINKKGMEKMRKKAASIHIHPNFNPFDNSMEIGASINF